MSAPSQDTVSMASGFLSLAPATSASYPLVQRVSTVPAADVTSPVKETPKSRTSSVGSEGAKSPTGLRILKLGPVHWGEHLDDHKADWHEVA